MTASEFTSLLKPAVFHIFDLEVKAEGGIIAARIAAPDFGRVIGRAGGNLNALRTLVAAINLAEEHLQQSVVVQEIPAEKPRRACRVDHKALAIETTSQILEMMREPQQVTAIDLGNRIYVRIESELPHDILQALNRWVQVCVMAHGGKRTTILSTEDAIT